MLNEDLDDLCLNEEDLDANEWANEIFVSRSKFNPVLIDLSKKSKPLPLTGKRVLVAQR